MREPVRGVVESVFEPIVPEADYLIVVRFADGSRDTVTLTFGTPPYSGDPVTVTLRDGEAEYHFHG